MVTNMTLPSRSLVRFYNKRGTAEQWIKEGKQATHWTRLSCHRFRANEVRLQLSVLSYNLGNLWRRLGLPRRIKSWSLTSLQQRLMKTGGRQAVRPDAGAACGATCAGRLAPTARTSWRTRVAEDRRGRDVAKKPSAVAGNGAIGQHSTAGAAGKGVSNVAEVRKPLHRGGGSPTLSVP